jgi:[protein-PII] uridylyltransferase
MTALEKLVKNLPALRNGGTNDADRAAYVQAFKDALAKERDLLYKQHQAGVGGMELVKMHTVFIDDMICQLFQEVINAHKETGNPKEHSYCLVATGGYGRGELNPFSDVDVMFIYRKKLTQHLTAVVHDFFYLLWDVGLNVGNSVRSIKDCISVAKDHLDSETAMLESRRLKGHHETFQEFQSEYLGFLKKTEQESFITGKLEEQRLRYENYDRSIYVQEPNVKESSGGLRDIHLVWWLSRVLFGCKQLSDLKKKKLCSTQEFAELLEAQDFLLRVRNELHFSSGVKKDLLGYEEQERVASALGYAGSPNILAHEHFMRVYYTHAKNVHFFLEDFLEKCLESKQAKKRGRKAVKLREIVPGLALENDKLMILTDGDSVFSEEPVNLLQVFHYQQRYKCKLHNDLKRAIRKHTHLIDAAYRHDKTVNDIFLGLLSRRQYVIPVLRTMHDVGVLGRLIPEFGQLTCFVQYDYFHRYTVDEHTLLVLQYLEDLAVTEDTRHDVKREVFKNLKDLHILRLAVLLHDAGKIESLKHSEVSVELIPQVARRMNLSEDDTVLFTFLVKYHTLMSRTFQLRDLEDQNTVKVFAEKVGSKRRLRMLYLLTYADTRAVAPGVWTDWKNSLLTNLYRKTLDFISLDAAEGDRSVYLDERREAVINACEQDVSREVVEEHLDGMHQKYIFAVAPERIRSHLDLVRELEGKTLTASLTREADVDSSEITICTRDQIGRFAQIVGILSYHDLNVLNAHIFTRKDGVVLDVFNVAGEIEHLKWRRIKRDLREAMEDKIQVEDLMANHSKYLLRRRAGRMNISTAIKFDMHASANYTIVEIHSHDRWGLLFLIAKILYDLNLNIGFAKIFTEGDKALDVFYVNDAGEKIDQSIVLEQIQERITHALADAPA